MQMHCGQQRKFSEVTKKRASLQAESLRMKNGPLRMKKVRHGYVLRFRTTIMIHMHGHGSDVLQVATGMR